MLKLNLFLFLLLSLLSCKSNKNNNESTSSKSLLDTVINIPDEDTNFIKINLDKFEYAPPLGFEDIFEPPVKIEIDHEMAASLGGFITLQASNDYFILSDIMFNSVSVWDKKGEFIRYIGAKGKNPNLGEFLSPLRGVIDSLSNVLYILSADKQNHCIIKYNINGTYLGYMPLEKGRYEKDIFAKGLLCDGIDVDNAGNIVIHYAYWDGNKTQANYYIYDKNGRQLNSLKTLDKEFTYGIENAILPEYNSYLYNGMLHTIDASGKIFTVKDAKFRLKYILTSKNSLDSTIVAYNQKPIKLMITQFIMETPLYLLFILNIYQDTPEAYIGCYDKKQNKLYRIKGDIMFQYESTTNINYLLPGTKNGIKFYSIKPREQQLYELKLKRQ